MFSSYEGGLMPDLESFDDLLIPRRAVLLMDEIEDGLCEHVSPILMRYALESASPVTVIIDSPGGDVRLGLRLHDLIRAMPGPTKGVVIGKCWSIAVPILQACTERAATLHSTFRFHEVTRALHDFKRSDRSSIAYILRDSLECQHLIEQTILSRSRLTLQQLRKHMREGERHEVELSAAQALKMGLIDRIVTQPFGPDSEA